MYHFCIVLFSFLLELICLWVKYRDYHYIIFLSLSLFLVSNLLYFCIYTYMIIHNSLRDFRTRLRNNQDRHGRKEHINRYRISPSFFCTSGLGVLAGSTSRGRSQWIRKRFVSWNLPKLSQLWRCNGGFESCTTQNHLDKTIREWYMKFQQSGCLCAAKRSGCLGLSAETVKCVREAFVRSPHVTKVAHIEQL